MAIIMKTLLCSLFLLVALSVFAQIPPDPTLVLTNNAKISLNTNDDAALRLAWRLDSNLRTNGLAPYTNIGPALIYGDWINWKATQAFHDLALIEAAKNEALVLGMYRQASDIDRAKVARILAGLTN